MKENLSSLNNKEGFVSYVNAHKDSIEQIVILLGISVEKFKRVVSWIRIAQGYTFDSEWTFTSVRNKMISSPQFMDLFYELLTNGYRNEKFTSIVPQFLISDFNLSEVLKRLKSEDYLRKLIKSKQTTAYNMEYTSLYNEMVENLITKIAQSKNVIYEKGISIASADIKNVNALTKDGRYIIITSRFYMTTSSGQTDYAEDFIQPLAAKVQKTDNIILVNMLDGAGWIGRPSDYSKIYFNCKYFLNLKKIDLLSNIIDDFLNC